MIDDSFTCIRVDEIFVSAADRAAGEKREGSFMFISCGFVGVAELVLMCRPVKQVQACEASAGL